MFYFDNAATTQMCRDARELENELYDTYGNAASPGAFGKKARDVIEAAREDIASEIGAEFGEVFFTSGATEGNNWSLRGAVTAWHPHISGIPHVVTTQAEHHSVLNTLKMLEECGLCMVTYVPVDSRSGAVNGDDILDALKQNTVLVSVIMVNNETGARNPVENIGRRIAGHNNRAGCHILFHVDATQALGKMKVDVNAIGCDMLTASGHKFHAGKGCGLMYLRKGTTIDNLMEGGGQQLGLRPGTEDTVAAARMALSLRQERDFCRNGGLGEMTGIIESMAMDIAGVHINGWPCAEAGIVNLSFDGVTSSALLRELENRGVVCSSGSACSMGGESHVLKAMGLGDARIGNAIRFSVGRLNNPFEVRAAMRILKECVEDIRNEAGG